jgi:dTDP-4-dehydrorhamnose reductase
LLDFVLQSLYSEKQIVGFTDVIFTPVSATEIANFLSNPCSSRLNGILNFGSKEVITKFEFLTKVTQSLGRSNVIIEQGLIANSALSVARPNYLALSSTLLEKSVGYKIPPLEKMISDAINYQI